MIKQEKGRHLTGNLDQKANNLSTQPAGRLTDCLLACMSQAAVPRSGEGPGQQSRLGVGTEADVCAKGGERVNKRTSKRPHQLVLTLMENVCHSVSSPASARILGIAQRRGLVLARGVWCAGGNNDFNSQKVLRP